MDEFILLLGAMEALLKDRLRVDLLELGLEVLEACRIAAAVGATAGIGHSVTGVYYFFAFNAPTIDGR
jgi:hypothetical protein